MRGARRTDARDRLLLTARRFSALRRNLLRLDQLAPFSVSRFSIAADS
jgi:hypothetical protein